jgi:hypothetical protein
MLCGSCEYTDGCCYTSIPPKVKCTITNEFHLYDDECNCEDIRDRKAAELEQIKKMISEPILAYPPDDLPRLNTDITSIFDGPTLSNTIALVNTGAVEFINTVEPNYWHNEPVDIVVGSTPCIVCGEGVMLYYGESGPRVCGDCKKAIKFIREKFNKELEEYEV